jgi:hypothetical protein
MTTKSETNGTTTPAVDTSSVLDKLDKDFNANFKGKTSPKRVKELVAAYQAATAARTKAEKAAEEAAVAESNSVRALIREACGKNKVMIGGKPFLPMSRGERVFFRKESAAETIDLG